MRQRKWVRWAAGLVALGTSAAMTAACSGSSTGGTGGGTKQIGGNAVFAETAGFLPNYILPFVDGGHFSTWNMNDFEFLMYRPLYWMGVGSNPDAVDPTNSLAGTPVWSNGGKSVTITLKNWKWSNGEAVDGQDVEFYINMYKAEESENGGYVAPLTAGGTTLNFFPDNVKSMSVNGQSITLNLDRAYNQNWYLFNELAQISPMPEAWDITGTGKPSDCSTNEKDCAAVYNYLIGQNKDLNTYASNPLWQIVDGPWHLTAYNADGALTMKPNPSYGGTNKPILSSFQEVPFTENSAEYNKLRAGSTSSGAISLGYLPLEDVTQSTSNPTQAGPNPLANQGYTLTPWIGYTINYFPLNLNNPTVGPLFQQLYIRQAIQETVDQQTAVTTLDKGYGYLTTGPQPLQPASSLISSGEQTNQYPFNPSKAKATLQAHGWNVSTSPATCTDPGTGPTQCGAGIKQNQALSFTIDYAEGDPTLTTLMQAFQTNAAQAGIKLGLVSQAGETITQESQPCTPSQASCSWQAGNWGAGWVYAPDYLPTGEDLFAKGSEANYGSFDDPNVDSLIIQSILSNSSSSYDNAENAIAADVPVVWQPDQDSELTEAASNLRGYNPQNVFLNINPEDWYFVK